MTTLGSSPDATRATNERDGCPLAGRRLEISAYFFNYSRERGANDHDEDYYYAPFVDILSTAARSREFSAATIYIDGLIP